MRSNNHDDLVDESKESLCGRETDRDPCGAPVDASRDFLFYFSSNEQRGGWGVGVGGRGEGGGGHCQTFFFFGSLFPGSADHEERDWPSCKVVFSDCQPI